MILISNTIKQSSNNAIYNEYVANISQTGVNAPVANIINENDTNFLGHFEYQYIQAGYYRMIPLFDFDISNAIIFIGDTTAQTSFAACRIIRDNVNNWLNIFTHDANTGVQNNLLNSTSIYIAQRI